MVATIFRVPICPVCYSEFDEDEAKPRILFNCGHVLCQGCLTQLYQHYSSSSTTTFVCYKCKTQHRIEGDDKVMEDHFPLCSNILKMLERPKTFFECVHFDFLPEKRICLNPACDQKNEFCVLCEQAIHFSCGSELIVKVDEFESVVDLTEFEAFKLPADGYENYAEIGRLLTDAYEKMNKILAEVKPTSVQDYLKKYKAIGISPVTENGKVKLQFKEGESFKKIVTAVNQLSRPDKTNLTKITFDVLQIFTKMDLSAPLQALSDLLVENPFFIHNQELSQSLLKAQNVDALIASATAFFIKEGLYKDNKKMLNKLLAEDNINKNEIEACKRQMNAELETPFRKLINFVDESIKAGEQTSPETQLYLFDFMQYQREVISWTFDVNYFHGKINSHPAILLDSKQRTKLLDMYKNNFQDNLLDSKIKRLTNIPITNAHYQDMLKQIHKQDTNSRKALIEYVDSNLSQYQLSHSDFTEIYQKLRTKQNSLGNRFESACRDAQKYLWTKTEFESIKNALTQNNEFKKYIRMMEKNKVSMVPETKFNNLLRTDDFTQEQLLKCIKSANEYNSNLQNRLAGKKTLEELIEKKKRFSELLQAIRGSE